MGTFLAVNDATFEGEVLSSPVPVLVEFSAEWCGPCKQIEPLLEQLGKEWQGRVRLVKLDVDQSVDTAVRYQVMSLPTVILFLNGEARQRVSGKQPRDRMMEKFSPFITQQQRA